MTPQELLVIEQAKAMIKRSLNRFAKAFVSGAVVSLAVVQPPLNSDPHSVLLWFQSVLIAIGVGGVMGVEKLISQIYVGQTPTAQAGTAPANPAPEVSAQAQTPQ